jgi:hypothetical protein
MYSMTKEEKVLQKFRENPGGVSYEQLSQILQNV